jgi:choice-of-anchor B domain-containing protein
LLSFVSLPDLGANGADGNDIWGWTDPQTKKEYAIVGTTTGTSFVDVTSPTEPCVLGFLPTHTVSSLWRDIKVYQNFAFIVSEASGHGMQVFELTQLRHITTCSSTFT